VTKYSEFWFLSIYLVHPQFPSLTTSFPSPHNLSKITILEFSIVLEYFNYLLFTGLDSVGVHPQWHYSITGLVWTRLDSVCVCAPENIARCTVQCGVPEHAAQTQCACGSNCGYSEKDLRSMWSLHRWSVSAGCQLQGHTGIAQRSIGQVALSNCTIQI